MVAIKFGDDLVEALERDRSHPFYLCFPTAVSEELRERLEKSGIDYQEILGRRVVRCSLGEYGRGLEIERALSKIEEEFKPEMMLLH